MHKSNMIYKNIKDSLLNIEYKKEVASMPMSFS